VTSNDVYANRVQASCQEGQRAMRGGASAMTNLLENGKTSTNMHLLDVPQRTIVVSQATASANKGKELPLSYLSPRLTIADQSKTVAKPWYHLTNVANADCN